MLICLGVFVWVIIFFGGRHEWEYNVPRQCDFRCDVCESVGSGGGCQECHPGYINGGMQCFDDPSELPPVSTAAGLGSTTYFVLIIMAQVTGATCQLALMRRLHNRRLLSRREAVILLIALAIEIVRMLSMLCRLELGP